MSRAGSALNILALGLGSLSVVAAIGLWRSPYGTERLFETGEERDLYWEPGVAAVASSVGFTVESASAPGLTFIREQVASSLASATTDLARATAIRQWVRREVSYGTATSDRGAANLAADDILRDGRRGIKSPCNRLAALFITACLANGMPARMVNLSTLENAGHFVAEVWISDLRRWVMVDPSLNYYAALAGEPASVLDLHRALRQGRASEIEIRRDGATTLPDPAGKPLDKVHGTLDYFRSFSLLNRNDFLTRRSKLDDHALVVFKEGSGPAHPVLQERLALLTKAAAALFALAGSFGLLVAGYRRSAVVAPPPEIANRK